MSNGKTVQERVRTAGEEVQVATKEIRAFLLKHLGAEHRVQVAYLLGRLLGLGEGLELIAKYEMKEPE